MAADRGSFEIEAGENVVVVVLLGEHDLGTADALTGAVAEASGRAQNIVIDVSKAAFVDSSVLHAIVNSHDEAKAAGCGFAIQYGTLVRRAFEVTGLLKQLPCADSRKKAVELARERGTASR